jgi:hypothetical protein
MDPKLIEILKKAKQVDQRAKKYDSTNKDILNTNVNNRVSQQVVPNMTESVPSMELPVNRPVATKPNIDVNSENYKQKVKESKLPPEIIKAMLNNPIQQPDMPGTFSMSEELIKEINPNYGKENYVEPPLLVGESQVDPNPKNNTFDEQIMRKMIAEEIAKALPSIVEKYFDKKMIQENINVLKSLKVRRKTNNTK